MSEMSSKKKLLVFGLLGVGVLLIGLYFVVGNPTKEYQVLFNTMGGSNIETQTIKEGEVVNRPTDPTKENSAFLGLEYEGNDYDFNNKVTSNITLTAKWKEVEELVKYDVTFVVNGEEKSLSISELTEQTVEDLSFASKDGYILKWYVDGKEYDFTTPLSGNMKLTGKYEKITEYTVKFNSDGGTTVKSQKVKPNETVSEPDAITKEAFIFVEWQLNGKKYDFTTPVTKNITLTAKWEEDPSVKRYEVKFDSDGGSKVDTQRVIENKTATAPKNPTKTGYKFVEWQLEKKKYDFKTKVTKDITLKAIWEEDINYTVTFDSNGGTNVANQTVKQGEKAKKPTNPTKTGYKFIEWLLDNKTYDFDNVVSRNITLVARYEKVSSTPTPVPVTPTPVPVTPTPSPIATPTPKPKAYTFKAIPIDDMGTPDVEIVLYDENNSVVTYSKMIIGGQEVQGKVINKFEYGNSISFKLPNGDTVTATKG